MSSITIYLIKIHKIIIILLFHFLLYSLTKIDCYVVSYRVNMNKYISFHRTNKEWDSWCWYWCRGGGGDNVFSSIRMPFDKQHTEKKKKSCT